MDPASGKHQQSQRSQAAQTNDESYIAATSELDSIDFARVETPVQHLGFQRRGQRGLELRLHTPAADTRHHPFDRAPFFMTTTTTQT